MPQTAQRPRIIVTRPEPDASAFAQLARGAGLEPVLSPVMTIKFRNEEPNLAGIGALAFTSANGVRAFAAAVEAVAALPAFAAGAITADAARAQGFSRILTANGGVEDLARVILEASKARVFDGAILHAAGSARAGSLSQTLAARDIVVKLAVLYDAVPAATLGANAMKVLSESRPDDCAALFSPRSARLFIDQARAAGLVDQLGGLTALCLSDAVAEAARAAKWRDILAAPEPSAGSLLETILEPRPPPRS